MVWSEIYSFTILYIYTVYMYMYVPYISLHTCVGWIKRRLPNKAGRSYQSMHLSTHSTHGASHTPCSPHHTTPIMPAHTMQPSSHNTHHTAHTMQPSSRNIHHAAHTMQPSSRNTHHAAHTMHAALIMQHTPHSTLCTYTQHIMAIFHVP